jgi:hypothetical protein
MALQRFYNHHVYNHRVYRTTTAYTATASITLITTTTLWISPLTAYFVPVIIALGLFLNTPLILTASALLYMFTASIGGRRRSRPNNCLRSSLRNSLHSLRNSLYSLRATAPVITSYANSSNSASLKLAKFAVKLIRKLYAKGLSGGGYITYRIRISTGLHYGS